jgi:predicted nucleic acid-binding protein
MLERAEYLFKWFDENDHTIIIPSIVLAEILASEPSTIQAQYLEVLNSNGSFIIAPFDARAALKYAQIMHGRFDEVKKIAAEQGRFKQEMKVDHLIIATAVVNNAECIYSYDNGLKAFASGFISVREFPPLPPKQNTLFD